MAGFLRHLFLICAGCLLLASPGSAALAAGCPRASAADVPVELSVNLAKVDYRYDVRIADITRYFLKQQRASFTGQHVTTGLTTAESTYQIETRYSSSKLANGQVCAWLTGANLDLGFRHMTVYVAQEYKAGTCEYKAVLDHEQEHVAIYQRLLKDYSRKIQQAVARSAQNLPSVTGATAAQAGKQLQAQLSNAAKAVMHDMNLAMEREHGRLDSPASYRATQARCRNW